MEKNSLNNKGFFVGRRALFVVFILLLVPLFGIACTAADYEDYAPILYFEGEETCYPVDVQYHLDNSQLKTDDDTGITYYDNTQGTISDNGVINDYKSKMNQYDTIVYYYKYQDISTGDTVIQYWMFYAFNKGDLNQHEGDWEMVEVVISSSGSKWVGYSQHHSGQRATWDQVERDGTNIKVYVARGSHANYLRSYSGKLGIASDYVGDNGKILKPANYELVELSGQVWIDDTSLWGEYGGLQDVPLGRVGPPGPQFRGVDQGNPMWNGIAWGNSLSKADNTFFMAEWFMYNFVLIFIILTAVSLIIIFVRIYLRHRKYGLGPRILSMLYIDGFNLKSIGNILCFVGIIIAIMGLIYPWYTVSADVNVEGYGTSGMVDIISIDGLNGVQIAIPGITGSTPMGNILLPFSLLIGISLIFMFLACIGINRSVKLGFKYIGRGIRVMIPIIILIITIALLGSAISSAVSEMDGGSYATDMFNSISGSPFGGQKTIPVNEGSMTGNLGVQWGVGIGGLLLLLSGIILIISGIFEVVSNKIFFEPKTPVGRPLKQLPIRQKESKPEQPATPSQKDTPKAKFCPECGDAVEENEKFCGKCGSKT